MNMVNIKINGMPLSVPADYTILQAAKSAGIDIPTLCYLKDLNEIGACRMCVVEVKGARSLVAACVYPVNEGMEVMTNTPKVIESRKMTLEMLLSVHNKSCLTCKRSGNCELQTLCSELGVETSDRFEGAMPDSSYDDSTYHLVRDNSKCILCRRCVAACADLRPVHCGLPHRRSGGKGSVRRGAEGPGRPGKVCGGADRPLYPRHPGRVLRHAGGHQRGGQNGGRPAAHWLPEGV